MATRCSRRSPLAERGVPQQTGDKVLVNQDEMMDRYPGMLGGKTGFTDVARKTFVGAAERNGRRLVVAMMYGLVDEGGPDLLGSGRRAAGLGFRAGPRFQRRRALDP